MDNRISVIVPAYNAGPWLPRILDSLLAQTYENMEILVVDDGSSDNTPQVLADYAARSEKVRFLRKENGGEYAARLSGVEAAGGEWIGFADADDEVEPEMYERLLRNALENDAQISHCGYKVIYGDGKVEYLQNTGLKKCQDSLTACRDLLEEKIMETGLCSKLFRKELFAGLREWMDFSIVNNGDLLMNYYLFSRADKAFLEDVCPYHYLIREGSASRRKPNAHTLFDPIRARKIILEQCGPDLEHTAREAMLRLCLVAFRSVSSEPRGEYRQEEEKLRQLLLAEKSHWRELSTKNALQIRLLCAAPQAYRLVCRSAAAIRRG